MEKLGSFGFLKVIEKVEWGLGISPEIKSFFFLRSSLDVRFVPHCSLPQFLHLDKEGNNFVFFFFSPLTPHFSFLQGEKS